MSPGTWGEGGRREEGEGRWLDRESTWLSHCMQKERERERGRREEGREREREEEGEVCRERGREREEVDREGERKREGKREREREKERERERERERGSKREEAQGTRAWRMIIESDHPPGQPSSLPPSPKHTLLFF